MPAEACDLLKAEQAKMTAAGIKDLVASGSTAVQKLGPEKLKLVERYIDVDEQLTFRCGLFRTRTLLPRDVEDGEPAPTAGQPAEAAEAPAKPAPKSKPRPKTAKAPADAPSGTAEPAAAKPAAAAKRKAKPDDAYRPAPPPASASD